MSEAKYPLKGMPFNRQDLDEATRVAFDAARRPRRAVVRHLVVNGRRIPFAVIPKPQAIGWAEARRRGYRRLIMLHYPTHHKRVWA